MVEFGMTEARVADSFYDGTHNTVLVAHQLNTVLMT